MTSDSPLGRVAALAVTAGASSVWAMCTTHSPRASRFARVSFTPPPGLCPIDSTIVGGSLATAVK